MEDQDIAHPLTSTAATYGGCASAERRPRVSIGLPVYNAEAFLQETLDSVLAQTFQDFELIISDNCSTDRTHEICLGYVARDKRVRYFMNDTNMGAAKNYNCTFALARGEYFKWLAADDAIEPHFLERCVNLLDSDPEMVLACSNYIIVNEHSETLPPLATYPPEHFHNLASPRPNVRFRKLWAHPAGDAVIMPVFGLIRHHVLRQTQLIQPFVDSEFPLIVDLVLKGKFGHAPEYLNRIRSHPNSYTRLQHRRSEPMRGEAEMLWFDPQSRSKSVAFYWRRLWEFVKLILASDETHIGKMVMLGYLVYPIAYWWRVMLIKELFFTVGAGSWYVILRKQWRRMKVWRRRADTRVWQR
jgi:glycosyltransferase involved in cell wall biosynthesis